VAEAALWWGVWHVGGIGMFKARESIRGQANFTAIVKEIGTSTAL